MNIPIHTTTCSQCAECLYTWRPTEDAVLEVKKSTVIPFIVTVDVLTKVYEKELPEFISTEISNGSVHWSMATVVVCEPTVHCIEHGAASNTLQ